MDIIAVRPKRRGRRRKAKAALYTVAFDVSELRFHDSSFSKYCKELCVYRIRRECAYQCNKDGEYGRLLHIWRQMGYLISFFSNQKDKLNSERYGHITVSEAIVRHEKLLDDLEEILMHGDLESLFVPLHKNPNGSVLWPESKLKSKYRCEDFENWIRLYAVRFVEEDTGQVNYILTGGGIKLVGKMSGFAPLEYEERKQEKVIQFLIDNEITTRDKIETVIL